MNGQPISGASAGASGKRRGGTGLSALMLGALLMLVTACGGSADAGDKKGPAGGTKKGDTTASQAVVTIAPKDGADAVATSGALKIGAEQGKLTTVKVADPKGNEVEGEIAADGASWTPERHLAAATKYTVHAVAKDSEGRESAKDTTFTTLVPANTFIGQYTPEDGSTVGVGMPVSINFTRGITDPEAVERAIKVTAEPAVEIEGHWFGNDRLDFRPEKYWASGTKVTVELNLDGVEGRPGVYGKQAKTVKFTIGRSQVSTVDASAKRMKVVRDGKQIKDIPISAGAPATTTYNGQMVISEKLKVTRMNGDTVGFGGEYDIKDVPHAMRLSTSGTFLHGNYWGASSIFGNTNTSHGCVGLRDVRGGYDNQTPAAWFYNKSLIGDVVIVKNSHDKVIQPDNGLNGWNMDWAEWKK
ncbi:Ig-like domain-containing protein [Streptomyces californicus]|uniref:L,D-transpeptidase n=1 Tax=Streptomyces TaxID=1883 RepID=UPI0015C41AB6|nr:MULTISPECIES: Ig-like domain-containing protein [Streptomyces]MBK0374271.1 L,D-transpeptidase family protein [Streptomyces sp. RB110-1]MBK0389359.1 L,D-transpeptidase family protein [Streptomyces sp. RB110-2]MCF3171170.1 L,D-transpeptidase family protein [Streptomyces violaceoruber]MDW4899066.1 Ig-like domain-containing protein [Streptomyces californicus]QLG31906.1 L,D-transpeptidase [Streptomyces sp. CB04723]